MSTYRGLHEILTQRLWDMHPEELFSLKDEIDKNLLGHIPFVMEHADLRKPYMLSSRDRFTEQLYVGTARYIEWYEDLRDDDQIINVMSINGPITRNGGACSYGSKEIRDYLMQAADNEHVIGHIIVIDSRGGSAEAKYDFEQAIAYVHEKNQKVIALIDGSCDSAAYALAALCDEIYVMNEKNNVGCIGTFAAFYYTPNGAEDAQTKRIFVERYAEGSPYKNKTFRDLSDGDDSLLMQELNKSAEDFKAMVRANRPSVTEEQLLGADYEASEVMGTMVDGVGTMQSCIDRILELSGNAQQQTEEPQTTPVDDPDGEPNDDPDNDTSRQPGNNDESKTPKINNQEMSKSFEKIQMACGAGALESDKNGLYLQTAYCEKLEAYVEQAEQKAETLDAKMQEIAGLNETMEQLKSEQAAALETLKAEYETKLNDLNEQLTKAAEAFATEKAALEAQLNEAAGKLAEKENELNEMAQAATASPKPEAPKGNGVSAEGKKSSPLLFKEGMSEEERRKAQSDRMNELRRLING